MTPIIAADLDIILDAPLAWERFAGKTILIAGAGGFLPAWMVWTLARLNERSGRTPCRIIALVRDPQRAEARLGHLALDPNVHLVQADIAQVSADALAHFGPISFLIHAASAAAPAAYLKDPVGTVLANIVGVNTLLDLARRDRAEGVLYFSSGEVYGETGPGLITEDDYGYLDPTKLRSCYGEAKRAAETLCVAHHEQFGVPVRIVRPLHTYGPGISLNDGRVFSDFVADIVSHRDLVLRSDGSAKRPFCYVADATLGFFTVLLKGADATPYMVGNPQGLVSIKELALLLTREAFPERGLSVRFAAPEDALPKTPISGALPDIGRILLLGWAPTTSVITGFRRTVMSFESEGSQFA